MVPNIPDGSARSSAILHVIVWLPGKAEKMPGKHVCFSSLPLTWHIVCGRGTSRPRAVVKVQ